jgi:nucleotide-binding universal stress UspA family protein
LSPPSKNSDSVAATFERMTRNRQFVAEWQMQKVPHVDLASLMMDFGRAADLIVAAQTDPDWDLWPLIDFSRALGSGERPAGAGYPLHRPLPKNWPAGGGAWKPGREAARATFDALPLLQRPESVYILEIRERAQDVSSLAPDTSIAAALARHGIKPEMRTSTASDISIGDEILSRVADLDPDLLVMGAYGHSRFRELVFGGATRHIARHMTLPTLFSH